MFQSHICSPKQLPLIETGLSVGSVSMLSWVSVGLRDLYSRVILRIHC